MLPSDSLLQEQAFPELVEGGGQDLGPSHVPSPLNPPGVGGRSHRSHSSHASLLALQSLMSQ
jgi:hypothetical protein